MPGPPWVVSASPEHVLATLAARVFAVVLTDLGFNGDAMAGRRVLDAARQTSTGCKVIAVTGRKDAEDDDLKGFDRVLFKPVDPFDLVAAVVGVVTPD